MKIITNHQYRYFLYGYEVPEKIRKCEFDYMDDETFSEESFILYKDEYLSMSNFIRIVGPTENCRFAYIDYSGDLNGWNGILTETGFSGLLIKVGDHGDTYKIGRYCSL
jgi:hypothetical protein